MLLCMGTICGLLLTAATASADSDPYPLQAVDTSSPRATLKSFRTACNECYRLIEQGKGKYRSNEDVHDIALQVLRCLNLSELPPAVKNNLGAQAAVCLKEVLDRIELPPEHQIPDAKDMQAEPEAGGAQRWTIPHTEITFAKVTEGPREGEFLFSPETVDRATEFYHRTKRLPYKPGASEGFYDWYLSEPGWMIPTAWIHSLPKWTRSIVWGQTVWRWIGLTLTLLLGIFVMALAYRLGQRRAAEKRKWNVFRYCITLVFPVAAMLIPLVVKYFVVHQLIIRGKTLVLVTVSLDVVFLVAVIVVLVGAGNRVAEVLISSPRIHPKGIDAQLIRLTSRVLSISAAVIVLLEGGKYLGIPMTTLLAGAGVGGLTVALAASDTLRNLFGSMMIILDKPYRVGERIVAKGYDGVVEEIGLRSTRIRLLTGHVATIPNEEMAKTDVENIGRRPHIRRIADIAIPLHTPPEKVQKALEIVRGLLEEHDGMEPDFPPRVFFTEFNRDSLNLRMIYWYHPPNYWDFLAFGERLNVQIMQQFEAAGIPFALPASTIHVPVGDDMTFPPGPPNDTSRNTPSSDSP